MRSAQSRLGLVTSLGAARRGVGRCVDALPVSPSVLRMGTAAFAGLAGVAVLRSLFSSRRKAASAQAALPPPAAQRATGRHLLSETVLTLLLPLCRRYFLGEGSPVAKATGNLVDRLLSNDR